MKPHEYVLRVYYEDVDPGKIVYHANYIKFMDRGRIEYFSSLGYELTFLLEEFGIQFTVQELAVKYHHPARLGQSLCVKTSLFRARGASLQFAQTIHTQTLSLLCEATIKLACVDLNFKPCRLPKQLISELVSEP